MTRRSDGISTGLARQDDFPELARVLGAAFPANPKSDPAVLAWQYDAPFGPTTIAVLREGDRIVGQWAAIPCRAIVDGQPAMVARTADAAILPSHRGRNLWPLLARTLFDICADAQMPVAFSYPNDLSVKGLVRVGWRPIGDMRAHVLLTSADALARRLHLPARVAEAGRRALFGPATGEAAPEAPGLPDDADLLWQRLATGITHGVVRDHAWMAWRYLARPNKDYRWWTVRKGDDLVGLAVAAPRQLGSTLFADVLELLAVDELTAAALVAGVRRDLGPEVDGLALGALVGSDLSRRLLATGFRIVPRRLQETSMRAGAVDTTGRRPELLDARWSLQWGDMDHL